MNQMIIIGTVFDFYYHQNITAYVTHAYCIWTKPLQTPRGGDYCNKFHPEK